MIAPARALAALGMAALLTGCPPTWGFVGSVRALPRGAAAGALALIPGAKVVCDGCSKPVVVSPRGEISLDLGTSVREPAPVVLHVSAPGYRPLDVTVSRSSYFLTEAGPASLTVILEPAL